MDERPTAAPAVSCRNLTVAYGGHTALRDLDLDLPAGRVTAIIGPNGSGKSTLLGVLSGLVDPASGTVEVLGRRPAEVRRRVAHVLQTTTANTAVPLTVRETVRMGAYGHTGWFRRLGREDRDAIEAAIDRLQVADIAARQLVELSGGQRQRAYVAQGLAQQADVLLLDEPITGLDLVTQEVIADVVTSEAAAGRTVVLTTHDVGTASLADHVVLLNTTLVASGAASEVLRPDVLARAYGDHAHVLGDGTLVIDEAHHHDHRHHDQL
ncbi:MAG: metal ABC transporter ATP-binding protein [Nitriliruptor sp.]|uniref:metal ABC transporter ATP-binding protein n=1 Tax=Nitriliruptor sp. TaxID=2448056 RepID=UPI0034A09D3A